MDHPGDPILFELAQRRLDADESALLAEHLRLCADCRRRFEQVSAISAALDEWHIAPAPADLEQRILSALAPAANRPSGPAHAFLRPMRIAAALLLAAGVGHAVGRIADRRVPVDEFAAAAALRLDVLDESSTTALLAALDPSQGGVQ